MNRDQLFNQIKLKKSFLCIGLDSDSSKIPSHLQHTDDPVFEFNKQIIEATHHLAVAYKPNLAFYEADGIKGWTSLEKTAHFVKSNYPELFLIADAKRGDIGNTSDRYARAFFKEMNFDAVTLSPYMGLDTVKPFLQYPDKWSIVLALTSNSSSADFQTIYINPTGDMLWQQVVNTSKQWASTNQLMYVVGATKAEWLKKVREIIPNHFLLVPGIGAQGGSLRDVVVNGMNDRCGLLVNSSRGIIFASSGLDFATKAYAEAKLLQEEMADYLEEFGLL